MRRVGQGREINCTNSVYLGSLYAILWMVDLEGSQAGRRSAIDMRQPLLHPSREIGEEEFSQGWLPAGEDGKDGKFISVMQDSIRAVEELDVPAVDQ